MRYGIDTAGMTFGDALQALETEREASDTRNWRVGDLVVRLMAENEQLDADEQVTKRWIGIATSMPENLLNMCWKTALLLPLEAREEVLPRLPDVSWTHCYITAQEFERKHGKIESEWDRIMAAISDLEYAQTNELSTRDFKNYMRGVLGERTVGGRIMENVLQALGVPKPPGIVGLHIELRAIYRRNEDE